MTMSYISEVYYTEWSVYAMLHSAGSRMETGHSDAEWTLRGTWFTL